MQMEIRAAAVAETLRQLGASEEGSRAWQSAVTMLRVDPTVDVYRGTLDERLLDFVANVGLFIRGLAAQTEIDDSRRELNLTLLRVQGLYTMKGDEGAAALLADCRRVLHRSLQWA
jgi:hypothetical protein